MCAVDMGGLLEFHTTPWTPRPFLSFPQLFWILTRMDEETAEKEKQQKTFLRALSEHMHIAPEFIGVKEDENLYKLFILFHSTKLLYYYITR
jgi:hypothetical protein